MKNRLLLSMAYVLPRASDEQKEAVRLANANNVVIDAVAGSGKTTTILYIATVFRNRRILHITYNAKLKIETRQRVAALGLKNIEVHSYHSFAVSKIGNECCTDAGIIKFLRNPHRIQHEFDTVILDEAQDMTFLYYEFMSYVISEHTRLVILGDKFQSIYAFNGADSRFITFAPRIFDVSVPFVSAKLSTSYRLTRQSAQFLNRVVLRYERLQAVKNGPGVRYVYSNFIAGAFEEINHLLKIYKPTEMFILAPSVRPNPKSPIRVLANMLSRNKIPLYIPADDDRKLDDDILAGKLVFSSFHQAKGLERKCVVVFGFDSSYYEFYNKNAPRDICPNELYVATTRHTEQLSLIHASNKEHVPFLDIVELEKMQTEGLVQIIGKLRTPKAAANNKIRVGVTELIRHLSSPVISTALKHINVKQIKPPGEKIDIPVKTMQLDPFGEPLYEEVSDITGIAIPAYYQYQTTHKMCIHEIAGDGPIELFSDPTNLLKLANKYNSMVSGLIYKLNQINKYDWLSQENLDLSVIRLAESLTPTTQYEKGLSVSIMGRIITGYIDALDVTPLTIKCKILWELKCTGDIQSEHILQTAIYAFMHASHTGEIITYRINNILTGEILEISQVEPDSFYKLVVLLIHNKYHSSITLSDMEFLAKLKKAQHTDDTPCHICELYKTVPVVAQEIKIKQAKKKIEKK